VTVPGPCRDTQALAAILRNPDQVDEEVVRQVSDAGTGDAEESHRADRHGDDDEDRLKGDPRGDLRLANRQGVHVRDGQRAVEIVAEAKDRNREEQRLGNVSAEERAEEWRRDENQRGIQRHGPEADEVLQLPILPEHCDGVVAVVKCRQ